MSTYIRNLKRGWLCLAGALAVTGAVGCTKAEKKKEPQAVQRPAQAASVEGELVVQTEYAAAVEALKGRFEVVTAEADSGVYLIRGKNLVGKEDQVIRELEKTGQFSIVERNFERQVHSSIPRDPKWLALWSLQNYGQDLKGGTEGIRGADIKALEAWKVTTGDKKVVVAVIDTGVDYTHPDLQKNMWINEAEKNGTPGVDDDGNGYTDDVYGYDFVSQARDRVHYGQLGDADPMDDHGHGTHVSGTIGAVGNNGIGVAGINWNVSIMALKFLSEQGGGTSYDEYRAMKYAVRQGVDVINASYGGGPKSKLIEKVMKELAENGTLFVAAAGNSASDNDVQPAYPCSYEVENVISVAATDNRDQLAEFSSYGFQKVHLAAPGVGILSTYPVTIAQKEGAKEEGDAQPYRSFSGTSMASPHVAGAAALVIAADPSLKGKPAEIKKRLMASADWLPQLAGKVASGGRLNLSKAVLGAAGTTPLAQVKWTEEAVEIATTKNPQERLDAPMKIVKPGAKAIQLHVKLALIDSLDAASLFDQFFRPIYQLPEEIYDTWLPPVPGDTVYLKFSNAMVSVQKYIGEKEYDDPTGVDKETHPICWQMGEGTKWTCSVYAKPSEPFANFNSEGVEIDRIRYAVEE